MKSFTILALAGLAAAQFAQLPTCAQSCANKFLTGGIGNCGSDAKCICSDKSFLSDIACCLAAPGGCDAADQSSAVVFASQLCAAQGVTVPSAVTCTSTAGGSGSGTVATATTTTGSGTPTETSGAAASKTESTSTTATGATTSPATTAAAGTTSSKSTNYAPRESAGVGAGLLGGVVAALALL
ncbi:hypothetical protein SPBR_04446 [Sporothrix brasiliensis 5110]|uniref:CFEM domain-containing protein n=1 Tax=Sporothrix brasiliensis 5110 TaxID=1398154 RepID=A0A0C2J9U6_9PEZI|nr:uncharacterized protein SPBR_04446 [Sporothrix brasiliensis 5110]KIH93672.1 hypothetical protein SPBR_04446 [Sporothrix brasiliensis 5110]